MALSYRETFDDDTPCMPPKMKSPNRNTNNISVPELKKRCFETLKLCRSTSLANEEITNIIFDEKLI